MEKPPNNRNYSQGERLSLVENMTPVELSYLLQDVAETLYDAGIAAQQSSEDRRFIARKLYALSSYVLGVAGELNHIDEATFLEAAELAKESRSAHRFPAQ